MLAILARFSLTSLSIMPALSRIAVATAFHLVSWSGVILSAALSSVMRCSTVSGLLLVAAAAAGGLELGLCAIAGTRDPASIAAPTMEAATSERENRNGGVMSFPSEGMACLLGAARA